MRAFDVFSYIIRVVLLAYLDEFGHVGPYISSRHPRFNTHPAFGYGGFILPADHAREFAAYFEHVKENLLAFEIQQANAHPRRWEKKGASLLTSRNMEVYGDEVRRALAGLARRLAKLGGRLTFHGQIKPIGSAVETGQSAADRSAQTLKQAIIRLARYADERRESIMIFMDSVDAKPRLEAVMAAASFIYRAHSPELRRVVEIPMQLESHFYATTQYADWLCALISRASQFHLAADAEFEWAPRLLDACFGQAERHHAESCIVSIDGVVAMRMDALTRSHNAMAARRLLAGARLVALGEIGPGARFVRGRDRLGED